MTIKSNSHTHHSNKNFTTVQNDLIRSDTLSCKAFKLLRRIHKLIVGGFVHKRDVNDVVHSVLEVEKKTHLRNPAAYLRRSLQGIGI